MSDRAEHIAALERMRGILTARFNDPEGYFDPWTLELLSIVEKALEAAPQRRLPAAGE